MENDHNLSDITFKQEITKNKEQNSQNIISLETDILGFENNDNEVNPIEKPKIQKTRTDVTINRPIPANQNLDVPIGSGLVYQAVLIDSNPEEEINLIRYNKNVILEQAENSKVKPFQIISKKYKTLTTFDSDRQNESINISKGVVSSTAAESESKSEDTVGISPHTKNINSNIAMSKNIEVEPKTSTILDNLSNNRTNFSDKPIEINEPSDNIKIPKRSTTVDTNSLSEDIVVPSKSFNSDIDVSKNQEDGLVIHTTNFKENIVPDFTNMQESRLAMLCDSDNDEEHVLSDEELIDQSQLAKKSKTKTKISKLNKETARNSIKKSKTTNADTEMTKKMTTKEAAELRTEIQSESQRMVRERNVSLPYHKPKAHSLKEFFAGRPRLALATTTNGRAPPSVAIKMSTEQLEIISKELKEREKEVKAFYKSESESENDDDANYMPPISDTNPSNEAAGISRDEGSDVIFEENENSNDNYTSTEVETLLETKGQKKKPTLNERESAKPMDVVIQNADNLPDDIDNSGNIVKPALKENETEAATSSRDTFMETERISQTKESEKLLDAHTVDKLVNPPPAADIGILCQISNQSYHIDLDDRYTGKLSDLNDDQDNEQTSKVIGTPTTASLNKIKHPPSKPFIGTVLAEKNNSINEFNVTEKKNFDKRLPCIKSKMEHLKERLTNIKPRLSGEHNEVIDLNSTVAKPKEVVRLMERFAKHVAPKKHSKHKVKLSIVTVESGGNIHKETVAVNVDNNHASDAVEEKPGVKLQRLKEELQRQIDGKKHEVWQQKAAEGLRENGESFEGYEHSGEDEKDILYDDDEEVEMTDIEDSEEELENDIKLTAKALKVSGFLDQEAQESGDQEAFSKKQEYEEGFANEEEGETGIDNQESENCKEDDDNSIMSNYSPSSEPSQFKHEYSTGKKRVLRRILNPDDDSDDEDLFTDFITQKSTVTEQLDSTVTADEDDIPPHQTRQLQTPMRPAITQTKSISDFLTPISFITSIQNLTSASKINKYGPLISPFRMPSDHSPMNEERLTVPSKNLFTDSDVMDSEVPLDVQITQTQESSSDLRHDNGILSLQESPLEKNDEPPSTQDLMGICSGEFTGVTQLGSSADTRKLIDFGGSQRTELRSLGTEQDMVISQLLDEEELENFKKKFDSPVSERRINDERQEVTGGGIIDSDIEDEWVKLKKKNNHRRITFSDDECSDEEKDFGEEEIDLQDKDEMNEKEIDNIGYDSEENELDLNEKGLKNHMKLADFLDVEAELSESEWGSEDEDEKDMDKLEFEIGDTETFDEERVRLDLEKIHTRRMLDDDAREVKLLQEVFLEDGELHGIGRQRQFKWKNMDLKDEAEEKNDDNEIYLDEEESEEQWRKKRHEREMFLKEKQHKSQNLELEDVDLLNHSQLFKIGQKVMQRSQGQNNTVEKINGEPVNPINKTPFSLLSKRGSFLSRSDQVLQRVVEYTKITTGSAESSAKTTKNFVFQSISASENTTTSAENKKRKASNGTPKVLKKSRLNRSPAVKKTLLSGKSTKLFNF